MKKVPRFQKPINIFGLLGDQESSVTLAQMKAGELVYVDTMDIGLPFPYMEKFMTSVVPHRFSFDRELPISQPTTIIHGTRDTTVKLESSVALHAKLPNSALIERDMGHHFNTSQQAICSLYL